MAEPIDSQVHDEDESESLRKTLEQMRREAEEEVQRLNQRLAERDFEPDSSVATATERLAMQQEMMVLQQTLEAKEQALDHITDECRRLEDELEDQNMAFEGLKQEVERKDKTLSDAQTELERMRLEMLELRKQKEEAPARPVAPVVVEAPRKSSVNWALIGIVAAFVLLSGAMITTVYLFWGPIRDELSSLVALSARSGGEADAPPAAAPALPSPDVARPPVAPRPEPTAPARPPALVTDRLRSVGSGPTMVVLSGGRYEMGNNSLSGDDFSPAHAVELRSFMIGAYEVTFREYDRFAQATGRTLPDDYGWGRGTRPVVGVSWGDATAYADWLARESGRPYRLPTESEWEYAARAGGDSSYWWGFGVNPGLAVCFDCGSQWDNRSTAPVGSFAPSPFGLYDTAGNAMEWVADCYRPSYQGAPRDGSARVFRGCAQRVARGGAFNKPSSSMRVFIRARFAPDTRINLLGFRVARDT